jgi:hypothetical protein
MSGHLLDRTGGFVRRFVVLNDHQRDALALFAAATHVPDAFDVATYLNVSSPLKRCGKSRLLEALELVVRAPLLASTISTAALYRVLEKKKPTLLLDEVDAIFTAKSEKEDLRGVINAGWRRSAVALRMGGSRMSTVENFSPFGFKVLAGIGDLPDTIRDRCILIRLERRTRDEPIERFRRRDAEPTGYELRDWLADWLEPQADYIRGLRPELPEELDDRAQDVWEPLLAIADFAGGDWPDRALDAALALSTGEEREEDSLSVQLLRDIEAVFSTNAAQPYKTSDLIHELCRIEESPWGDWYGKPITPQRLGKLLKPYRIKTMPVWVEGEKHRGYKVEQFADAFLRVLSGRGGRGGRSESPSENGSTAPTAPTTQETWDRGNSAITLPGDAGFIAVLTEAHRNGHLTEAEAQKRWAVHRLLGEGPRSRL